MSEIGIAILDAIEEADTSEIDALFQSSGRDILEVTPSEKWNWLHKCLQGYDPDEAPAQSIDFLISKGIPVNAQDMYGMTPLHYAVRSHNLDAVRLLLEAGANPNLLNDDGKNPLRQIINLNHSEDDIAIIKLLVDNGIDLSEKKEGGKTVVEVLKLFDPEPIELIEYMEAALEA